MQGDGNVQTRTCRGGRFEVCASRDGNTTSRRAAIRHYDFFLFGFECVCVCVCVAECEV